MQKKKINIRATVRVISTAKGILLSPAEHYEHQINIMPGIDYPDSVLKELVDSETRLSFLELFRDRMKKTPALRNKIGGTKWSVDVLNVEYEHIVQAA